MNRVEVNPRYRETLALEGLSRAADFLACVGEPISVREDRRVDRVVIGPLSCYLKRETTILARERWLSWWGGFGWTSKSVREGMVLADLERAGVSAPIVLALGEFDGQGFVLIKEEPNVVPLDEYLRHRPSEASRVSSLLGRELARMHDAGFYHPDLFAKHVLLGREDGLERICLIDWQRTRRLNDVTWSRRAFDLAALDASLDDAAVAPRHRLRLLASYLHRTAGPRPRLRTFIDAIRGRSWRLLKQRRVARQRLASAPAAAPRPQTWNDPYTCPLRLTEPSLAVLPLVEILRPGVDDEWRRRALARAGHALRSVHEAGYRTEPGLESWVVRTSSPGDVEVYLTNAAALTPTMEMPGRVEADDLARPLAVLFARHGSRLGARECLTVLDGYLGAADSRNDSRIVRRDLVRRIRALLDAREPAR